MALRRLRDLHDRLGQETVRLLEAVIIVELRWCELGNRLCVHPCTAKKYAIGALRRLARMWH